jgi:Bacterial sugar transferase
MRLYDVVLALAFALLTDVLGDWVTKLSRWLVKAAALRVPRKHRAEWEEDWLADLEGRPRLIRPFFALDLFRAARGVRREYWASVRVRRPARPHRRALGAITAKRLFDVTVASVMMVVFAPLMAVIAIAIRLTSRGPILLRQRRHGLHGKEIMVYRFRSLAVEKDDEDLWRVSPNDSRVTPLGRVLRRTSLDELPQVLNVLQGRMSLIGPRRPSRGDQGEGT